VSHRGAHAANARAPDAATLRMVGAAEEGRSWRRMRPRGYPSVTPPDAQNDLAQAFVAAGSDAELHLTQSREMRA
jgi:hypothetical protein